MAKNTYPETNRPTLEDTMTERDCFKRTADVADLERLAGASRYDLEIDGYVNRDADGNWDLSYWGSSLLADLRGNRS